MYTEFIRYLGTKDWFARLVAAVAPLDARVLKATGGRFGLAGPYRLPQLLLTTTGRRSGQPRTVTLLYGEVDGEILLIGSNFGQTHHPAWALNLESTPQAVIEVKGVPRRVQARMVTDPAERERVWTHMAGIYPGYAMYRAKTDRDIKVFAVRPDEATGTIEV